MSEREQGMGESIKEGERGEDRYGQAYAHAHAQDPGATSGKSAARANKREWMKPRKTSGCVRK